MQKKRGFFHLKTFNEKPQCKYLSTRPVYREGTIFIFVDPSHTEVLEVMKYSFATEIG